MSINLKSAASLTLAGVVATFTTLGGLTSSSATTYTTDFSTIGANKSYIGPYSDGGITVQYVGNTGGIWTTSQPTAPSG